MATKEELLEQKAKVKAKIWEIEQKLKDKTFVSSVDFASMYPSIIRLLNASIENLVGFLDDNPIAYRKLGLSKTVHDAKETSKNLVKGQIANSRYVQFVGKNEEKVSLRREIYRGDYDEATIEEITETPFERFFLANMGLFDPEEVMLKFQGKVYSAMELQQLFKENNYSVSGSGAVYKKDEQGLIPSYLEYLFMERKRVKKEMMGHYKKKILLQKFKMACEADGLWK